MTIRAIIMTLLGLVVLALAAFARDQEAARSLPLPPAAAPRSPSAAATAAQPARPAPEVRIVSVRTDSGGVLDDEMLPFCSADTLRVDLEMADAKRADVRWRVVPFVGTVAPVLSNEREFAFRLAEVAAWPDPYAARPAFYLEIVAALVDSGGKELASDTRIVLQSDLGQLRQEYVDHPLVLPPGASRVPGVGEFTPAPRDGSWNDGDYDWALISDWAAQADTWVQQGWTGPVRVNSVYRSPARHWRLYAELGRPVATGSRHLWGMAIDYQVADLNGDGSSPGWGDYNLLSEVCALYGRVVPEGRADHVHLQQPAS